jgi:uncharacterized protein (DUF1697 family)
MAELRQLLTGQGHRNVATLLQSGNVVLDAELSAPDLAAYVSTAIGERFGFPVAAVVRTRDEVHGVLARDPLGDVADDGSRYVVAFLAEPPGAGLRKTLDAVDAGDDRYVLDGREIYVWCPHGQLKSPLMAALGTVKGGPVTTVRNWNTVGKLAALLDR